MRLYYMVDPEDQVSKSQLCDLWCQHQHLDLCDVTNLPQPYENLSSLQPIGEHQIRSIHRVGVERRKLTLDWSYKNLKDFFCPHYHFVSPLEQECSLYLPTILFKY